jgi:hypothetical protein
VLVTHDIERLLDLIQADGRRAYGSEERGQVVSLWFKEFKFEKPGRLEAAVMTFLREKPRGRPTLAELWAVLRRGHKKPSWEAKREEMKTQEVLWAASILESPEKFETNYRQTIQYAERVLRHWGYATWQDAMADQKPGWTPPSREEVIL